MGTEIITDALIAKLLSMPKFIQNPATQIRKKGCHEEKNFEVKGEEGYNFVLYTRQSIYPGLSDDFSSGLAWLMPSGQTFTLVRYNGRSHNHSNHLEKEELGFVCHIHKATEKYILARKKADGYAEATYKYHTLKGALHCLVIDCNISGIETQPDLPQLFVQQ